MRTPRFDPREYFLLKLDTRIEQVVTEYSALIETFNKRMEEYVSVYMMKKRHKEYPLVVFLLTLS